MHHLLYDTISKHHEAVITHSEITESIAITAIKRLLLLLYQCHSSSSGRAGDARMRLHEIKTLKFRLWYRGLCKVQSDIEPLKGWSRN